MHTLDVITEITAATSRASRERIILEAYAQNCQEFFQAVNLAADPFVFYGVKKAGEIMEDDGDPGTLTFEEFRGLCEQLRSQVLIGESARLAILAAAERCHTPTWNLVYRRILLKDLNVDVTMVNRLLKRLGSLAETLAVPVFRCQTATPITTAKLPTGIHLVEAKIPGERMLAILDKSVVLLDSDGRRCSASALEQALQALADRLPQPIVLDGVIVESGEYMLFDLIPLADFRMRHCRKTQRQRRDLLEAFLLSGVFAENKLVHIVPYIQVDCDTDTGRLAFIDFSQQARNQGYQNLVLKKPDAAYQGKQSRAWLLWKITIA